MNKRKFIIGLLGLPLLAFTGCTTNAPQADKLARVQTLCTIAAKDGTILTLQAYPQYKPAFDLAYTELDALVSHGTIVPAQLADILKQLNIKQLQGQNATILIGDLPLLIDLLAGNQAIDLTKTPYVLAAATGIRDGLGMALGKTQQPAFAPIITK